MSARQPEIRAATVGSSGRNERSSRMRTDDLELAFAIRRASVTDSSAVSVEWPLLKPDWLASSLLLCERNNDT